MFDINNLKAVEVSLASPDAIRSWSHGEVTEPETINYRTQKPEENGLFCERIFGPSKDYECHCGKYKKIRFKGIICDKCGVEVTSKEVRRERMGHIELASPCTHIWYLKGIPSRIGLVLDVSPKQLEEVAYFAAHICLNEGTDEKKCKFISYKEVLDERSGREVFGQEIKDITDNMTDHETADYVRGIELLDKLNNPAESFDFFVNVHYIEKFRNVEFGEGADAIKRLLKEVNLNKEFDTINKELETANGQKRTKLIKRLEVIQAFRNNENKPEWMVLDVIPVIPPDLRPMLQIDGGRFAASDLNELYRRVITRNNRLKRLIDNHAPYVMQMNEKRMLQEAVDALIDNGRRSKAVQGAGGRPLKSLSSSLKGKQGRFRQNLLGKRVDYSGRSVIAVGPSLKMYQCGIPREMAIQLLRPFIACELIKPVEEGGQGITLKEADKYIDRYDPAVFDVIERIIGMHPVLLNRAPTLHRLGIQAFQPKLVDGRAIRLHPLVCPGFNADFDGDQMAVHVPLSKSAQEEALHLMLASNNILGPKDGKPITIPSQDMVLGNYYLTIEETKEDFEARAKRRHVSSAKLLKSSDNAELREGAVDLEEADQLTLYAECEGKVFRNVNEVLDAYATHQVHLHDRIAIRASSCGKYFGTTYQDYLELEHKDEERNIHVFEKILTEKEFNDIYNGYLITTAGKVIFNQIFPQEFPYINDISEFKGDVHFYNCTRFFVPRGTNIKEYIHNQPLIEPVKKKNLGIIINEVFSRYGKSKTSAVLDKIKDQGFKYSTVAGLTVSISDINVVDGKKAILDKGEEKVEQITDFYKEGMITDGERHKMVVEAWKDASNKVAQKVVTEFVKDKRNPLFMMYDSGARGNKSNFAQLLGTRGLMSNPKGEEIELPVKSCFREGMTVSEFFIATHGARKGGADTALKTADSGYLTRRLVDVSQDVIVRERDCHTDHGFVVSDIVSEVEGNKTVIVKLRERLIGRYALHDVVNPKTGEIIVKGTYGAEDIDDSYLIDEDKAKEIVDAGINEVEIRSLFGCETKDGVCEICYGRNVATNDPVEIGQAVGIMAAQSIGEPGTQLTMRTFHTGGVAGSDITQGLPRVQELVEARDPKGKALISIIDGKVTKITPVDNRFEFTVKNDKEEQTMISDYGAVSVVKKGDMVEAGDQLTKGAISPKELLEVSNTAKVERYLIKEILKVYSAQGIGISDKHIEVIIRQMLRKVYITDSGDTTLLPGTKVSVDDFTAINEKALMEGKQPAVAHPIILGITKAALEVDSFLSAASFQETTRVLTDAAIKAKRDDLHGLKENVICGKLIPAGTGVRDVTQENDILSHFDVIETMKGVKKQYIEVHDRPEDIDD